MAIRYKIFSCHDKNELENDINNFIEETENISVLQIQFDTCYDDLAINCFSINRSTVVYSAMLGYMICNGKEE